MSGITLIAEVGSVHDGSFGNALKLIEAAASVGAHMVKFQTHIAAAETTRDAPSPSTFSAEPRYEYFERTGFSPEQWKVLSAHAADVGVGFASSPFSIEAVELLESVGVDAYKVASGEVGNLPLLRRLAATGAPVWLSSGMSDWAELDAAVQALDGGGPLTVMQCASRYPCPPEHAGLNVIAQMRARYGTAVGFSDHTDGIHTAVAAAALGATVIEKHLTFSRLMYGSDAALATEPPAFAQLAAALRDVAVMHANPVDKDDIADYADIRRVYTKSVVLRDARSAGTVLAEADLAVKKPGTGIPASEFDRVIGRVLGRDLPAEHVLVEEDLC